MADTRATPVPTELRLKKKSRSLEVSFDDGSAFDLPAEYLRVHSPSAEVTGHAPGEGRLVAGKEAVSILKVEPVGRYAVKLVFDDGHDTGLYTWPTLYDLGANYASKWQRYRERLAESGESRSARGEENDR